MKTILSDYILLNTVERGNEGDASYFVQSGPAVTELAEKGIQPERVYVAAGGLSEEDLHNAVGKCRFVADSPEELRRINRIATEENQEGHLASVGLRVIPTSYDKGKQQGIREADLPSLSAEIRELSAISVRGCFIQGCMEGLHGKGLGQYFRNCYELAKRMTVILPCAMPYLCVAGGADAVLYNLREHPETLPEFQRAAEIMAMQNNTAFYAKLLLM